MKKFTINHSSESGVVLFFALIALVVMSLAAVTLIRSVDTNTVIAGNLSFKQSALVSSDRAVESALNWLEIKSDTSGALDTNGSTGDGYFASYASPDLDDPAILKSDATWDNNSALAAGTGITDGTDETGNHIRYIVQRMCSASGSPTAEKCLLAGGEVKNGSLGGKNDPECCLDPNAATSPMYRITVKVTGPKNTVSYTQTFVY